MTASVIRLPAFTRSSASIPSSDLPVSLGLPSSELSIPEANQFVDFTCRYGSHFDCPSSGEKGWLIDLYHRRAMISGFALQGDIKRFPIVDALVRVRGVLIGSGESPSLWVKSLEPLDMLSSDYCIFDTALPYWISDKTVVDRACRLWGSLPDEDRLFINAVFFDPRVLRGFLMAPGSCNHHHAHDGGCIEHSVESAELAETLAASSRNLDRDLLITTALIHDSGKALEYTRTGTGKWQMSRYGRRVGHKISGIQLATIAMTRCPAMSGRRKESYMHMLACSFAPAWVGLRKPDIPEAAAMAGLDRSSAEAGSPRMA